MRVLDLFSAAAGGWSLGMHRAGFQTVAACEWIDWRRALYVENNPGVLIYDDVRDVTGDRVRADLGAFPDIVVGSPPCQDISSANTKGKSVEGSRAHPQQARSPAEPQKAWEQAGRQRWRALALVIKAKPEAVAAGITTVEDEFLAHTVLPDGSTVGQFMKPQLAIAYEQGSMPSALLLGGPS